MVLVVVAVVVLELLSSKRTGECAIGIREPSGAWRSRVVRFGPTVQCHPGCTGGDQSWVVVHHL